MIKNSEEYDRPLNKAAIKIGPAIREIGQSRGFSLMELKSALATAMQGHDFYYVEETINGFLYGRAWPQMTRDTAIEIVSEAFKSILKRKNRADESKAIISKISKTIKQICMECENESNKEIVNKMLIEFQLSSEYREITNFVKKSLAAFSSLTEQDILFWETLSKWNSEQREKAYESWKKHKADYQTIISPAFQQWVALRGKGLPAISNQQQQRKGTLSMEFSKQIQKLSGDEAQSVRYILNRLRERVDSEEGKKYPLALPEELDILILFKYFLPGETKGQYIEKIQKEQKKTAGDN